MSEPLFFDEFADISVKLIAETCNAEIVRGDGGKIVNGVAALEYAGHSDIVFFDNVKYVRQLAETSAACCLVSPKFVDKVPEQVIPLQVEQPYRAFAHLLGVLYPQGLKPIPIFTAQGVHPSASIASSAQCEANVCIDAGAVIGENVELGENTYVGPNTVIGPNCKIGRNSSIGANTTCQHALIGDHVIIHPGVRIGQDGFGFAMGDQDHLKVPQVGRAIIQDYVEIGANTTIDRGANRDTIIGEGTKIDNQVQIAHNVEIGRHCIIVSQVGLAGSVTLGDFVVFGGQSSADGHVTIGDGTQIAGVSCVYGDLPGGGKYGGIPAVPVREWFKQIAMINRLSGSKREKQPKK